MAKKSRRSRRVPSKPHAVKQQVSTSPTVASASVQPTAVETVLARRAQSGTSKKTPNFGQEYHYVISDLKRVGILAAALLAGLIILSFVL